MSLLSRSSAYLEMYPGLGCLICHEETPCFLQCAKKVVFNSPGLVDFAIALVIFVLNLSDGQVLFGGESQITEGL